MVYYRAEFADGCVRSPYGCLFERRIGVRGRVSRNLAVRVATRVDAYSGQTSMEQWVCCVYICSAHSAGEKYAVNVSDVAQ